MSPSPDTKEFFLVRLTETVSADGHFAESSLSPDGIKTAQKSARAFAKRATAAKIKIRTLCCNGVLASIQMADIFHDEIPGKIRVFNGLGREADDLESVLALPASVLLLSDEKFTAEIAKTLGVKAEFVPGTVYRFTAQPAADAWSAQEV